MGKCSSTQSKDIYEDSAVGNTTALSSIHDGSVRDVLYLKHINTLVTCSDDKTIRSFDISSLFYKNSANYLRCCSGHTKCVNIIKSFESILFSASRDLSVKIWDIQSNNSPINSFDNLHDLNITGFTVTKGVFSTGSRDYSVKVWDVESKSLLTRYSARRNVVTSLSYDTVDESRGTLLYQGSEDLCVRVWDTRNPGSETADSSPAMHLPGYTYFPTSLCSPTHNHPHVLVTGSKGFSGIGCEVRVWDLRWQKVLFELNGHQYDITDCQYIDSASSGELKNLLVTCSKDGCVAVWDVCVGKRVAWTSGHGHHFTSIEILPVDSIDDKLAIAAFVIGSYDGSVSFFRLIRSKSDYNDDFTIERLTGTHVYAISDEQLEIVE